MVGISGRRLAPMWFDIAVAVLALASSLALAPGAARAQPGTRPLDAVAYGLVVAACAALVVRRRYPVPVAGVVGVALLVFAVRDYPGGPLVVTVMIALYTVGARLRRRDAIVVGAVAVVLLAARSVAAIAAHGRVSPFSWAAPGWVVACLLAGVVVRTRRQAVQAIRDRAEFAERTREEEARARVAEERLRIARDLHDVVGHGFATVHVQARAAAALLDGDPAGARQALGAIESTSRDALREIRATLRAIRGDGTDAGAGLEALLAPARAAGLEVRASLAGAAALPVTTAQVVYRVVQESLTNVLRHAHAGTVTVSVVRDGGAVRVEVADDGGGPAGRPRPSEARLADQAAGFQLASVGPQPGDGHGLTGMRERVEAVGGRLDAGPRREGGWRVSARVPVAG